MARLSRGWKWALAAAVAGGIAAVIAASSWISSGSKLAPVSELAPSSEPVEPGLTPDAQLEPPRAPVDVEVGDLVVNGSGCPRGGKVEKLDRPGFLEISFEDFKLGAGETAPRVRACSIALALTVPAGTSLRLIGGEWSGLAKVDPAGKARIKREHFLVGAPNPPKVQELDAGFDGSFFFQDDMRDELPDDSAGWTACAEAPARKIARASAELDAEGTQTSLEISFGRVFNLETRPCTIQ